MKKYKSHTFLGDCVRYFNKYFLSHLGVVLIKDRVPIGSPKHLPSSCVFDYNDFLRLNALELLSTEIERNKVEGAVAELGVYRGNFASIVNKLFPTKKLYLYDTFESFHEKDIKASLKYKHNDLMEDFSNTNVDLVLSKMPNRNMCCVRKGYFPQTAQTELKEHFCFVSIDPDLFDPTYQALKFFYPRLNKGGYIFVHDYLSSQYEGCRKAIQKFSAEEEIPFFILPDHMGSAVFMK